MGEANSREELAGVIVRVGVMAGVLVGSTGPAGGSVASIVGDGSRGGGVGVDVGTGVKVGSGAGVGSGGPGMAMMNRLITILLAIRRLTPRRMFSLRVRFRRLGFRLLTTINLL